ncbi:hypothetical protein Tco_0480814, partial [Tanacetum coccineum]
ILIRDEPPTSFWSDTEVARLLAIPTSPPSPLSPCPICSLGYRAALIRMRAEALSTSHSPPLHIILSHIREDTPPSSIILGPRYEVGKRSSAPTAKPLGGFKAGHNGFVASLGKRSALARPARLPWRLRHGYLVRLGTILRCIVDLARSGVMALRTQVVVQQAVITELQAEGQVRTGGTNYRDVGSEYQQEDSACSKTFIPPDSLMHNNIMAVVQKSVTVLGSGRYSHDIRFLQQLHRMVKIPVTVVKQRTREIDTVSYHKLFDVLKQFQNEVNDIRSERLARSANPLALLAAAQPWIAKPVTPQSESVSEEDSDPEKMKRDKGNKTEILHQGIKNDSQSKALGESKDSTVAGARVQNHDENDVFANVRRHSEQPESINDTYVLEKDDSNVIPDSSNISELEKYTALNDLTSEYKILQTKLNDTLGLLALKDIDIKEGLKTKTYELLSVGQSETDDDSQKEYVLLGSNLRSTQREKTKHPNAHVSGRSTFANPKLPQEDQSDKTCLYEITMILSDLLNRFCLRGGRDRDSLKRRVDQNWIKTQVKTTYQLHISNSLYETFKPPSKNPILISGTAKELGVKWRKTFVRTKAKLLKYSTLAFLPCLNPLMFRIAPPQHKTETPLLLMLLGLLNTQCLKSSEFSSQVLVLETTVKNYQVKAKGRAKTIENYFFCEDLMENDLLTGNRGSDLYTIYLQETTSSTPIYFMAKASPTQNKLWHRRLSNMNFNSITLLSKKDVVIQAFPLSEISQSSSQVITVRYGQRARDSIGVVGKTKPYLVEDARSMLSASMLHNHFGLKQIAITRAIL